MQDLQRRFLPVTIDCNSDDARMIWRNAGGTGKKIEPLSLKVIELSASNSFHQINMELIGTCVFQWLVEFDPQSISQPIFKNGNKGAKENCGPVHILKNI